MAGTAYAAGDRVAYSDAGTRREATVEREHAGRLIIRDTTGARVSIAPESLEPAAGAPTVLELGTVCEWFALCERRAELVVPHPAFPAGVPACARCAHFAATGELEPAEGRTATD